MFEVPGSNVKTINFEEDTVRGNQAPHYEYHEDGDDGSEETVVKEDENGAPDGETVSAGSDDVALEQSAAAKAKV